MINIVIPMAGAGSRFSKAGYALPKPFIDVSGRPMIERVLENLTVQNCIFTLIMQKAHAENNAHSLTSLKKKWPVNIEFVDSLTEGTACTVLAATRIIDNSTPLVIANSDQLVDFEIETMIEDCQSRRLDGSILTFTDAERNPKWSFAKLNADLLVSEVQEKKPISEYATVGIYLFSRGSDFVSGANAMIQANDRVNNEFYTCPVYNYLIRAGKRIGIYNIDDSKMHGLGTPEDLNIYLDLIKSK